MSQQRHFIRQWRKHRQLTQEQLAERIGINRAHLSKIETGARDYDQKFLEAAALELRCEPADLLMRDPTSPQAIWSLWDQVPEKQRPLAVEVLKGIIKTGTDG